MIPQEVKVQLAVDVMQALEQEIADRALRPEAVERRAARLQAAAIIYAAHEATRDSKCRYSSGDV